MDIEIGKIYENKTWKFLVPCLRYLGEGFVNRFKPVFKLAVGVYDTILDGTPFEGGRKIFLLIDTKIQPQSYKVFYSWIKEQDYYVLDYYRDALNAEPRQKMIVLEFPEAHKQVYDSFIKGSYSKMFKNTEADKIYTSPSRKRELQIVKKQNNSFLLESIKKEFNADLNILDFKEEIEEFELPLKGKEEIFNYTNKEIFINKIL